MYKTFWIATHSREIVASRPAGIDNKNTTYRTGVLGTDHEIKAIRYLTDPATP